jgi:predicted Co/Zn/Cd cation transporter (cation efflux family)
MKFYKFTAIIIPALLLFGCTQIITAPIKIVGATAGAIIDVTGSAIHAVAGSDNEDEKKKD